MSAAPTTDPTVAAEEAGLAFTTAVSIEARRLAERDAKVGGGRGGKARRGWAWHTRVEFDKSTHHPFAGYGDYLQQTPSPFWSDADTKRIQKVFKGR